MSPRGTAPKALGRPRDGESSATRERLLIVARQAFARVGYGATTNKMIAEAAGITAGAIYHYYPSKADLYAAVYGEVQAMVQRSFERDLAQHHSFLDRFKATLDSSVTLNRLDPSITGFVVNVPYETQRHPELVELLAPHRAIRQSMAGRMVADAVASGELGPDVDAGAVRDLINAVFSGLARFHNHVADTERHARAVGAMERLLEGSLIDETKCRHPRTYGQPAGRVVDGQVVDSQVVDGRQRSS